MHYEGNIIRPPSEAGSILLQVTVGCSHNKCTFCGTYTGERFKIKSDDVIMADIAFAAQYCQRQRRVFLCDGDALIIPQKRLLTILSAIRKQLPWVTRIGVYANAKSLGMKTPEELGELRAGGIGIAYMGLETGDDLTLKKIKKGATSEKMIAMGRKARAAGLKLSVTVLLGIAGKERSQIHAAETGRVLSEIDPEYVGALSLMLIPGTPLVSGLRKKRIPTYLANGNAARTENHDRQHPSYQGDVPRKSRFELSTDTGNPAQRKGGYTGPHRQGPCGEGKSETGIPQGSLTHNPKPNCNNPRRPLQ